MGQAEWPGSGETQASSVSSGTEEDGCRSTSKVGESEESRRRRNGNVNPVCRLTRSAIFSSGFCVSGVKPYVAPSLAAVLLLRPLARTALMARSCLLWRTCSLLLAMQQLVLSNQFNESGEAFVHIEDAKSSAGHRYNENHNYCVGKEGEISFPSMDIQYDIEHLGSGHQHHKQPRPLSSPSLSA